MKDNTKRVMKDDSKKEFSSAKSIEEKASIKENPIVGIFESTSGLLPDGASACHMQ